MQKSPKALATAGTSGQISLQCPSVLIETKGASREAQHVPGEPKAAQTKQVWKVKQKAPREVLGVVEAQLRLSREDKGKMPLNFGSITDASHGADLESLSSPNLRVLVPSANFAPTSGVKKVSLRTNSSANAST